MKISPKMKKMFAEIYGLESEEINKLCSKMNSLLEIRFTDNRDDIFVLVLDLIEKLTENEHLDEKMLYGYVTHGFSVVLLYFTLLREAKYNREKIDELVISVKAAYEEGKMGYCFIKNIQESMDLLYDYHDKGTFQVRAKELRKNRSLCTHFETLIDCYKTNYSKHRALSPNSIEERVSSIRLFLWSLEKLGVFNASEFNNTVISDAVTFLSKERKYVKTTLYNARTFLTFLYESGLITTDYSIAIPRSVPHRRKIQLGFTDSEINLILSKVNRSKPIGKRDYAIMLIAARTGLRRCDISSLKRSSLDLRLNEIRIVQQKTNIPLTLPLTPEVGNAIIDYFYNGRGDNDSKYIFVKCRNSQEHIKGRTITALTAKYIRQAGLADSQNKRNIHSFRKSFGKRLLEASITTDMLMEMLGQVDVNSVTPYTAIDENGLKHCSLSLSSVAREVS